MRRCVIEGCDGASRARGLCDAHYRRLRFGKPLERIIRRTHAPAWQSLKAAADAFGKAKTSEELATSERALALAAKAWVFDQDKRRTPQRAMEAA